LSAEIKVLPDMPAWKAETPTAHNTSDTEKTGSAFGCGLHSAPVALHKLRASTQKSRSATARFGWTRKLHFLMIATLSLLSQISRINTHRRFCGLISEWLALSDLRRAPDAMGEWETATFKKNVEDFIRN